MVYSLEKVFKAIPIFNYESKYIHSENNNIMKNEIKLFPWQPLLTSQKNIFI